jgi:hypothetical protein
MANQRRSLLGMAHAQGKYSQRMVRVGVGRVDLKDAAIQLLGFCQVSRLVALQSQRKHFGDVSHR